MTPNDIVTNISDLGLGEVVDIVGVSTNFTYCFNRLDDSNTWD